jgi:uncharacterized sodium:solute symporter family permease YidK
MRPFALLSSAGIGDFGIFPFILILLVIAIFVVVGVFIWEIFINKKHVTKTTVITITDTEETESTTINSLEDIDGALGEEQN